jgi:hypothetical protein
MRERASLSGYIRELTGRLPSASDPFARPLGRSATGAEERLRHTRWGGVAQDQLYTRVRGEAPAHTLGGVAHDQLYTRGIRPEVARCTCGRSSYAAGDGQPLRDQAASGALLDLANPDPAAIHLEDIAAALSKVCRFGLRPPASIQWRSTRCSCSGSSWRPAVLNFRFRPCTRKGGTQRP